jgi:hypothetical protein
MEQPAIFRRKGHQHRIGHIGLNQGELAHVPNRVLIQNRIELVGLLPRLTWAILLLLNRRLISPKTVPRRHVLKQIER